MQNSPLFKKTLFNASRRAILENELILRKFLTGYVLKHYNVSDLKNLNDLLEKISDNDLYGILIGSKNIENLPDYDNKKYSTILVDLKNFTNKDFAS